MDELTIRRAIASDAAGMAAVHVTSWQETYRGLVADKVLDDPEFVNRRERYWTTTIPEAADGSSAIAVAERDGRIVGIASVGAPADADAAWQAEIFVIYVLSSEYGSGAGGLLLGETLGSRSASLWVADPNPRAQAFYRKHGFVPDGHVKNEGIPAIRMVRN
jgi:ribosomal protein S18 acetylase RimI-like enzyme